MFNLDPGKLLIIAVVAVILLGPDKLPQVARQAGNAWKTFNDFRHRMESEVRGSIPDLPSSAEIAHLARSPTALLHRLSEMGPEGNGTAGTVAASAPDLDAVPDGTPIEHVIPTAPVSAAPNAAITSPEAEPAPADVTIFGDPSLN